MIADVSQIQPGAPLAVRPLHTLQGVASLLEQPCSRVQALAKAGAFRWVFDISAGNRRIRELRFLGVAVSEYMAGRACCLEFADVLELVSRGAAALRAVDIYRWFNAREATVYALIKQGELQASRWHRGNGGSAVVAVQSLAEFLKRRCYPNPVTP